MAMNSFHSRAPKRKPPRHEREAVPAPVPAQAQGDALRADAWLVAHGLAASRAAAQRMIEAGRVSWDGVAVVKPAQSLPANAEVTVADDDADRYVSRGGLKLAGALAASGIDPRDRVCLDLGQSTGGFTDCLLQAGAARVVGVDVGHDQLHPRLREHPRVVRLEGINARFLDRGALDTRGAHCPAAGFDLIVGDLSFISLTLVLPRLPALLAPHGQMLLLVKPQFEVGPQHVGKGGIVRDAALYPQVAAKLSEAARAAGLRVRGWFDSPIAGGDGNREFFLWTCHEQA
ncbi:TlyA family rRNA (cytidine-2'-O)-methyltransferase [Denitratisoma sp. DHT3]|uniref:TlyA family RNA methyltransferase n=1 Tax=Denitratisoma sp. DHT3 TaxID=1981880 RepID=UPI001198CA09|nr:TlyA family RNA methyltransferase [Denitratisoma sp. DHT3]QDX82428.1 TlyA family rRNA (cytidine-2'-O)-methyltransferase [Denitratisoma sp. DHT3]